jgi:tripartite-type tricarboxylate transporter receptor subunit TctC
MGIPDTPVRAPSGAWRRLRRQFLLATSMLGLTVGPAMAWPDKPIELVVGFAAGGGTDTTARTLAAFLSKALDASVVVVNKPGASGAIGLGYVARATPDGHVIGMTNMPGLVTLPIERKTPFVGEDFAYLANLVRDPSAFSSLKGSRYKTVADLIADAKARPGQINYGSTGVGTDDHLAMVLFERQTGVKLNHVPFNGAGPLRTALYGGHIDIGGLNLGEVMPYRDRLNILAAASDGRSRLGPDVPTFREQKVDLVFSSERGIVAPKGIPDAVRQRLTEALRKVANDPAFQQQMAQQFTEMDFLEGAAWKQRLDQSTAQFRALWHRSPWAEQR